MKYFLSSVITLFVLSSSAWAMNEAGGKDKGVQLDVGGFYEQYSNNNTTAPQNIKTTTTNVDGLAGLGYGFGHLYLGGTYLYSSNDAQTSGSSSSDTKSTVGWLAPTVGYASNNFRIYAGYVATATDAVVSGATTTNYSSGTGWFASVSYSFYVSKTVYIAPVVAYYDVNFTASTLNGAAVSNTKYEITNLQPLITVGFDF